LCAAQGFPQVTAAIVRVQVAELLALGESIGLKERWLQGDARHGYHLDLTPQRRAHAVAAGALEVDGSQGGQHSSRSPRRGGAVSALERA
jgi:hypothetical protein